MEFTSWYASVVCNPMHIVSQIEQGISLNTSHLQSRAQTLQRVESECMVASKASRFQHLHMCYKDYLRSTNDHRSGNRLPEK